MTLLLLITADQLRHFMPPPLSFQMLAFASATFHAFIFSLFVADDYY